MRKRDELAVVHVLISLGKIREKRGRALLSGTRTFKAKPLMMDRLLTGSASSSPEIMTLMSKLPLVGNASAATAPDAIESWEDADRPLTTRRLR